MKEGSSSTSSYNLSLERRHLEEIKRQRNQERTELLKGLCSWTPNPRYCVNCGKEIFHTEGIRGRCLRCTQEKQAQAAQTQQLYDQLNRYRDQALISGTLLADALFDGVSLEATQTSTVKRRRGLKLSRALGSSRVQSSDTLPSKLPLDLIPYEEDDSTSCLNQSPELFCHIKKCSDKYSPHEMLVCDVCKRGFHARCCHPPLNYHIVIRYSWLCTSDKVCTVCHTSKKESSLLLCDGCDRSFHQWCATPPVDQVPEGEWCCSDCKVCETCKQELTVEEIKSPFTFGYKNVRICSNCLTKQPKTRLPLCYVCHEIKEPHQVICQCSGCEEEVHRADCCGPGPSFPVWCLECLGQNNDDEGWMSEDGRSEDEGEKQQRQQEGHGKKDEIAATTATVNRSSLTTDDTADDSDDQKGHEQGNDCPMTDV